MMLVGGPSLTLTEGLMDPESGVHVEGVRVFTDDDGLVTCQCFVGGCSTTMTSNVRAPARVDIIRELDRVTFAIEHDHQRELVHITTNCPPRLKPWGWVLA